MVLFSTVLFIRQPRMCNWDLLQIECHMACFSAESKGIIQLKIQKLYVLEQITPF